jgi:hypothetical protein
MTITTNKICSLGSAALLALTLAVTGCRTGRDRTAGQAINDKMTAFNVNHALNSDPVLKFPDVKVNVYNGNAQLTGFVNTDEQRAKAARSPSSPRPRAEHRFVTPCTERTGTCRRQTIPLRLRGNRLMRIDLQQAFYGAPFSAALCRSRRTGEAYRIDAV